MRARRDAQRWASDLAACGSIVVRTIGLNLPLAFLRACGLAPVSLPAGRAEPGLPLVSLSPAGLRYLAAVFASPAQPLLIATNEPTGAMLFAAVRELIRTGELADRPLHGLDLLQPGTAACVRYNRARLSELAGWASSLGGQVPDSKSLHQAYEDWDGQRTLLSRLDKWRCSDRPRLPGVTWLNAVHAAGVLPPNVHQWALQSLLASAAQAQAREGARMFVAGAESIDGDEVFRSIEDLGVCIVGDDLNLCESIGPRVRGDDLWDLAAREPVQPNAVDPIKRAHWTVARALELGASRLAHVCMRGDESQPWLRRWLEPACEQAGIQLCPVELRIDEPCSVTVRTALMNTRSPSAKQPAPGKASAQAPGSGARKPAAASSDRRSQKSLAAVADFSKYQREWFQAVRLRAQAGEPFAVVNADAPQEILRTLDIPFVVNQWWASIVAAKQQSRRYLELLREHGYPTDAEPYSAQGLAAAFDSDAQQAPWGGLPRPQWLFAFSASAATRGIYTSWSSHTGAECWLFDRTVDTRVNLPGEWWEHLPHHWDEMLEAPRLDLIEHQFGEVVQRLEQATGRRFDEARFRRVMDLVNEQEDYFRRTRDLIARSPQAPVGIVDTMPATMVPQWHRGTEWGRDAARQLFEEVSARVEQASCVCPDERLRLMWVGRGLWSNMGFYQRWERSHGAVFVWSMYLALAADGYLRYCRPEQSALRALAARFVTMGDELRMPTWAGSWYVHEAASHRVDAAIAIDDADPLVLRALERAGIPVLRLALNNFAGGNGGEDMAAGQVETFLNALPGARRPRH